MEDQDRTSAPTDSTEGADAVSPLQVEASAPSTPAEPPTGTPPLESESPSPQQPTLHRWQRVTRRQVVAGVSIAVGIIAGGGGLLLALQPHAAPSAATIARTAGLPRPTSPAGTLPPSTPVPDSLLDAWRTNHLTVAPAQRFQHQTGAALVPLGIIEPAYPLTNPRAPAHLHLYLLGGELVSNQLFWYAGLETQDGTQFVAKLRIGPVDASDTGFGLQITQQSTDDIEGGPAEDPQATVTPRRLYQVMSSLVQHCMVATLIPKPVSADVDGLSNTLRSALNQQASIADHFLQFDFDVLHRTPFTQVPASERNPIQGLIDPSPIRYQSAADGAHYPLITQLVFRHSDQVYAKLVSS